MEPFAIPANQAFAFLTFAHLARCAAAIFFRAAAWLCARRRACNLPGQVEGEIEAE